MTRLPPAIAGLAALSCLAIANTPASADPPPGTSPQTADDAAPATAAGPIRIRNVNSYAVLDRQHLVLRAGASRRYLVTLQRRCSGLRSGMHLGLSLGRFSTIHNPRFEFVETREDRCYFDTIEPVESNDEARTLIAARAETAAATEAAGSGTR